MNILMRVQCTATRLLLVLPVIFVWSLTIVAVPAANAATDEWKQQARLRGADTVHDDEFGYSVALSGDTAIIGAPLDDIHPNPSSTIVDYGSAYVFRFDGSKWVQTQKLFLAEGEPIGNFGGSVALSGDTAIIAAPFAGAAYVYHFNGSEWVQTQKLVTATGIGRAVALAGNTAIITAPWDDGNVGSAYVYRFNGNEWVQTQKLVAADGTSGDVFGNSVALSGDTAIIGAARDDTTGSAYVFRFNGSEWVQEAKLRAADGAASDLFGYSVALSGDAAIIGAIGDEDYGYLTGAAYVFRFNGSEWVQQQKLLAADAVQWDVFGHSVAISGDTAIIGAPGDDLAEDTPGYAWDPTGSAYVFRFNGTEWVQTEKLRSRARAPGQYFGGALALSGQRVIVGAEERGAAYVFTRRVLVVAIDIKPGNARNVINPRSQGKVWVAILSTSTAAGEALDFDALQVDPASARFGPQAAAAVQHRVKDVDHDGDPDLLLQFDAKQTGIACGDTTASLSGATYAGQAITGTDVIKTVGCEAPTAEP